MSLYGLTKDVRNFLVSKGFPLRIFYGPERMYRDGYYENVVVFERDHEASDSFLAPRGEQRNPRKLRARMLASQCRVYAKSSVAGAMIQDHHELCEKYNDALFVAIQKWAQSTGAIECPITESRYMSAAERLAEAREEVPADAQRIQQWPGVVYRIKFLVPRALLDLDFDGLGLPTATLEAGTLVSKTEVYPPGSPEIPVIAQGACGFEDPPDDDP